MNSYASFVSNFCKQLLLLFYEEVLEVSEKCRLWVANDSLTGITFLLHPIFFFWESLRWNTSRKERCVSAVTLHLHSLVASSLDFTREREKKVELHRRNY